LFEIYSEEFKLQQKYMKFRNAYLLVYKRKLTDDSKLVKKESEDQ